MAITSRGEIWLIGGVGELSKKILSFDLQTHTFKELPMKLNIGRSCHRCTVTKIGSSEVILVTGGIVFEGSYVYDNSVEIINIQTGSVTLSSPMNIKRACHGIGILNIKNQPRISVFGGFNDDSKTSRENSIEIFDKETLKWELVHDITMNEARYEFGYLTM